MISLDICGRRKDQENLEKSVEAEDNGEDEEEVKQDATSTKRGTRVKTLARTSPLSTSILVCLKNSGWERRIYEVILEYRNGVKPDNIWKSLGISRQWVHEFLRKLKEENKIFEDKDKYYPVNSDLNNIYLFATE